MSEEITPTPRRAGTATAGSEVSTNFATAPGEAEAEPAGLASPLEQVDPAQAFGAAIEREFVDLRRAVEALVWRMYGTWGRRREAKVVRARAEEVLLEAIERAWRQAASFDPTRRARAWILGFAVFVLQEQERAEWRHQKGRVDIDRERRAEDAAVATAMLDRLHDLRATDAQRLIELFDLVSAEDGALIRTAYLDGQTRQEMAAALGIAEGALRLRLHRAARRFRMAFERLDQPGTKDD